MRYPAEETARKHERLLKVASALLRERGVDAVGVSEVMKAAGMTHGAFYSHFDSKDDLVSAAIQAALDQSDAGLTRALADPVDPKASHLGAYLSPVHRDDRADGCPMAALAIEIGLRRRDVPALSRFVRRLLDRVVDGFSWSRRGAKRDQAILMTAAMVGALILARSVEEELSDEILAAVKRQLLA